MKHADRWCLVAIVALATLFLLPALLPGHTLLPLGLEGGIAPWNKQVSQQAQNLLLSDPFYQYYPFRYQGMQALRQGQVLLWNPYVLGGHPALGDPLGQTFYPPNMIASLLFPLARGWVFLIWGHLVLTGVLMYAYLRQAGLRPESGLLGATVWMLNANIVVWLETPHFLSTLAWLPGVFWLLEKARRTGRWRFVAGAGLMYGAMVLAGQTQYAIGAAWLIGLWGLFQVIVYAVRQRRVALQPLMMVAAVGVLGIGIGTVQLAPSLELTQLSHRANPMLSLTQSGWPLRHIVTLWLPDFYGNPVRAPWWGDTNIAEMAAYFGLWPFVLSLCALMWSRRWDGRFWGGTLLLLLLIVLGTPAVYLFSWLPGSNYVALTRLLFAVPFAGSIAAAFALDAARERLLQSRRQVWLALAGVLLLLVIASAVTMGLQWEQVTTHSQELLPQIGIAAALVFVGAAGWVLATRRWAGGVALILGATWLDLMLWGMPFNPVNSVDILYPENPIVDWLRQDPGLYRVLPLQSDRVVFGPNVLSVFGYQEPGGYSSQVVGRYRELGKAIDDRVDMWWMASNTNMLVHSQFNPWFSMLNVKYVLSSYQRPEQLVAEVSPGGCDDAAPLRSGELITQTFSVANPGLNRLDLRFDPAQRGSSASLRFWLWRERAGGELVAEIPFASTEIAASGEKVFFFAPAADSLGQKFVWGLQVTEAGPNARLALCRVAEGGSLSFGAFTTQLKFVDTLQGVWIYENPNVLPRAYVSHHAEVTTDQDALARIREKTFDPWHTVLVPAPASAELEALTQTSQLAPVTPANVVAYEAQRVVIDTEGADAGILVLSDAWYPGWRVTVDGAPADLLRVNYALRGVYLPAGAHQVTFSFHPKTLYAGAGISVAALLVTALIPWLDRRRHRQDDR